MQVCSAPTSGRVGARGSAGRAVRQETSMMIFTAGGGQAIVTAAGAGTVRRGSSARRGKDWSGRSSCNRLSSSNQWRRECYKGEGIKRGQGPSLSRQSDTMQPSPAGTSTSHEWSEVSPVTYVQRRHATDAKSPAMGLPVRPLPHGAHVLCRQAAGSCGNDRPKESAARKRHWRNSCHFSGATSSASFARWWGSR